jgi:hypothetical protein
MKVGTPRKPSVGYDNRPGWRVRVSGREGGPGAVGAVLLAAVLLAKPTPMDTVDDEEVSAFCKSESGTEGVYVPGSKMKFVSLVNNVAPKFVIFVVPLRH